MIVSDFTAFVNAALCNGGYEDQCLHAVMHGIRVEPLVAYEPPTPQLVFTCFFEDTTGHVYVWMDGKGKWVADF